MGSVWQERVCVGWRKHALVAIEVNFSRKCPSLLESERILVFSQQHFWLYVTKWPRFHKKVVIELHPIKHSCIICVYNGKTMKLLFCWIWQGNEKKTVTEFVVLLTDRFIGNKGFIVKAENLCYIVQIWVLDNERPKWIVHSVVEVCDSNLHPPIFLVILLYVPVNSNRAHVMCAMQQRGIVFPWCIDSNQLKNLRIIPLVIIKPYHKSAVICYSSNTKKMRIKQVALLYTIALVLATTGTRRTRCNCIVVERWERNTTIRILSC